MARLRCLRCNAVHSRPVVYGYPGPELIEAERRGEVVLGGCNVGEPVRVWFCEECERTLSEDEREALAQAVEAAGGEGEPE